MEQLYLIDEWTYRMEQLPELRQYQEVGYGTSYPLPAYENSRLQVRFFFHVGYPTGLHEIRLGPAVARVTLDADTFEILEHVTEQAFPFIPSFESIVYERSILDQELNTLRTTYLKDLYDRALMLYPHQPSGTVGPALLDLFQKTIPPVLWPYYEALSPDFISWLKD